MSKVFNYYKAFGFKELVKKLFRVLIIKIKTNGNNIYLPSKIEYLNSIKNDNYVYYVSNELFSKNKVAQKVLSYLDEIGICMIYMYSGFDSIKNDAGNGLLYYKKINEIDIVDGKTIIYDYYNDFIKKHYKNKAIYISNINDNEKFYELLENVSFFNNKLVKKYYGKISIIVLNYNNKDIINKCIDSLISYKTRYDYEIVVVDNQSTDGSYEIIKSQYKNKIKLIKNTKNGCSSGRNLGVKNTNKDFVLFLDSDQWALNNYWLDNYLYLIDTIENFGAIGWAAGWFNKSGVAYHTVDNFEFRFLPTGLLARKDIGYLGTGGMILAKSTFEKINGFDENYDPTCYEDTDISLKIRNLNMELYYSKHIGIYHKPHQTTKSGSKDHFMLINKNGKYFKNKWLKINRKLLKYIK